MLRRLFTGFALSIACMMITIVVLADDGMISVSSASGSTGDSTTVSISVSNNPGLSYLKLKLEYDSTALEISSAGSSGSTEADVTNTELIKGFFESSPYRTSNPYYLVWMNASNSSENGVIANIVFTILKPGVHNIKISVVQALHYNTSTKKIEDAELNVSGGKIKSIPEIEASIRLGSSLTLACYIDIDDINLEDYITMSFTRDGVVKTVSGKYDSDTGKYVFEYTGINPQCMTDPINITLYDGTEILKEVNNYTVLTYCDTVYRQTGTSDKLKTLMADMLIYGKAAQTYMGYRTEDWLYDIPTWIDRYKSTFSSEGLKTDKSVTSIIDSDNYFKSAFLRLGNTQKIIFMAKSGCPEDVTVKLYKSTDGNDYELIDSFLLSSCDQTQDGYRIETDDILAWDYERVYMAELVKNAEVIQTATYSIESYIVSFYDGDNGYLIQSLCNYGNSAYDYIVNGD